jgi:hypothetical protein
MAILIILNTAYVTSKPGSARLHRHRRRTKRRGVRVSDNQGLVLRQAPVEPQNLVQQPPVAAEVHGASHGGDGTDPTRGNAVLHW